MPWKYLRMTRRCTCVTQDLAGRGKMIFVQRFIMNRCYFLRTKHRIPMDAVFCCMMISCYASDPLSWVVFQSKQEYSRREKSAETEYL